MAAEKSTRLAPDELGPVNRLVFGRDRTAGATVAQALRVKHNTLWSYLNRGGLSRELALRLADDFGQRAAKLMDAATLLRRLAG